MLEYITIIIGTILSCLGVFYSKGGTPGDVTRTGYFILALILSSGIITIYTVFEKNRKESERIIEQKIRDIETEKLRVETAKQSEAAQDRLRSLMIQAQQIALLDSFDINKPFDVATFNISINTEPESQDTPLLLPYNKDDMIGTFHAPKTEREIADIYFNLGETSSVSVHISGKSGSIHIKEKSMDNTGSDKEINYSYTGSHSICPYFDWSQYRRDKIPRRWFFECLNLQTHQGLQLDKNVPSGKYISNIIQNRSAGSIVIHDVMNGAILSREDIKQYYLNQTWIAFRFVQKSNVRNGCEKTIDARLELEVAPDAHECKSDDMCFNIITTDDLTITPCKMSEL
jgi:hypothetical protein